MVVGQVAEGRDVVVVGAGPGGCEVALRAAELGRKVTLVDRRGVAGLGGECLHTGCIPSKTLIEHANRASDVESSLKSFQLDRERVIDGLRGGLERQLQQAGVEVIPGLARFITGDRLVIDRPEGPALFVEYRTGVIATGSRPVELAALPFDGVTVLDSAGLLALEELPRSLVVVGGGYVGVELGTALAKLGVAVTIVEMAERVLPEFDADVSAAVSRNLARLGVALELRSVASGLDEGGVRIRRDDGADARLEADRVLVAVGRHANTADLGLADAGARVDERGLVETDELCRAGERLYAIGDARRGPALAHKATAEARMVAEVLAGVAGHRSLGEIPLVVFSDPEVASVGRTMSDVTRSDGELVAGKVPIGASGRAATLGNPNGFARVVAERASGAVVGVQLVAPHASELIAAATMAIELGAVADDLDDIVFAHPTLAELLQLAARAAGKARS